MTYLQLEKSHLNSHSFQRVLVQQLWLADEEKTYTTVGLWNQWKYKLWLADEENINTTAGRGIRLAVQLWLADEENIHTTELGK